MTAREQLAQFAAGSKALPRLCREYKKERATVHLKELVGGALSFYAAAAAAKTGGVHVFVAEDRDAAAYLMNDFYNLLTRSRSISSPRPISVRWPTAPKMRRAWCSVRRR